jgi:di/tricarboxylate transporter
VSGDAWLTLAVLVVMVAALITDRASPAVAVTGATATLFILDVVDAEQAFSGFSNPAPLTVAALYVVAGAISKTRALQPALGVVLQTGGSPRRMLARLCIPATATSAFLANTPIVAMLVPPVTNWCRRTGQSASKLLIPLSYATILGGVITAIGTSTNLVVSGLLVEAGQPGFDLFELTKVGLPVAIVGLIVLLSVGPWLLPDRRSVDDDERAGGAGYTVAMVVVPGGPLVGRSVEDGGLRHLQGVFLVEIERAGTVIAPIGPDFVLQGGDHLRFVGNVDLVVDLQQTRGLESAEAPHLDHVDGPSHTFSEAVVGPASPLVGRTLREADFRGRYQAAVVAIQRSGQRVREKLGVVRLRPGDMLLVLADERFAERWRNSDDFLLVARLGGASPRATRKAPVTLAVLAGLVLLPILDLMTLFRSALLAAGALVLLGVLRPSEARDSIDLNVCVVIGSAFGLGQALQVTGLADRIADGVQNTIGQFGEVGALLGLVLIVVIFTELITNAAAVALAFPIAAAISAQLGYDQRLLAVAVAVAGSASFLTPIGYQTNMMVYGPGGYRFTDYMRVGIPLSIAVVTTIVVMVVVLG